jgi:hypothetical protein
MLAIFIFGKQHFQALQNLLVGPVANRRLTYNPQPVRLERIYENAISVLSPVAEQKQISFLSN